MPTTEHATGAALLTGPLAYALGLFLFGVAIVLVAAVLQAAERFRATEGMSVPAALLRALPYVIIGGPIRFARQRAGAAAAALGIVRADFGHRAAAMRRHPANGISPEVLARVSALRPANVFPLHRGDFDLTA